MARMRRTVLMLLLSARGAGSLSLCIGRHALPYPTALVHCSVRTPPIISAQPKDPVQFERMKRADLPTTSGITALQTLGGALGAVLGPQLVRSSTLGLLLGVAIAR
tara:strand:+ start:2934 stop:3251 length:318 start_codon:yes stop_codon:yes gene_type:complete